MKGSGLGRTPEQLPQVTPEAVDVDAGRDVDRDVAPPVDDDRTLGHVDLRHAPYAREAR